MNDDQYLDSLIDSKVKCIFTLDGVKSNSKINGNNQ